MMKRCVLTGAKVSSLLSSCNLYDTGAPEKFSCKTQSIKANTKAIDPRDTNIIYYNYIKDKKEIEVYWDSVIGSGKNKVGTYNTYEKDEKIYWGKKDYAFVGTQYHSLLSISTMRLKTKVYDTDGVLIQEIDDICKRGW